VSLLAQFEETRAADRRDSDRRALRLTITASLPESPERAVTIHDLSETGLLLETEVSLSAGQTFQVFLPVVGAVETTVVWNSHQLYGCQFGEHVARAAISAALLQSVPKDEQADARRPPQDLLSKLRDLNDRIGQVRHDLDLTIEQFSASRQAVQPRDSEPAELPLEVPERYAEQVSREISASSLPVVIVSLILAGLAALILIAALLALPLSS